VRSRSTNNMASGTSDCGLKAVEVQCPSAEHSDSCEPRSTSASGAEAGTPGALRVRRRPIPRKGHTKSRNGCYNCKRRKVKCQENQPECYHCKRIGLACEYPPPKNGAAAITGGGAVSAGVSCGGPSPALQATPTLFTIEDMRFFQHFLIVAYPSLPIGGDEIWKEVAQMSHHVS
jgi:hypothetical protein